MTTEMNLNGYNSDARKRIVIFDDSKGALRRFVQRFEGINVEMQMYSRPKLDDSIRQNLEKLDPELIVVGLMMGESLEDGYYLIKELHEFEPLREVPIVVASKYINDTAFGRKEKEKCLKTPGVVAAYSKFPNFPPAQELLRLIPETQL
jgi:PleD family two-component response regulator